MIGDEEPKVIGTTLGHYRVLAKLGEGGMGEVYAAEDTKLQRRVALKMLPPEMAADPERLQRFQREARAIAALNHPNIVTHLQRRGGGRRPVPDDGAGRREDAGRDHPAGRPVARGSAPSWPCRWSTPWPPRTSTGSSTGT